MAISAARCITTSWSLPPYNWTMPILVKLSTRRHLMRIPGRGVYCCELFSGLEGNIETMSGDERTVILSNLMNGPVRVQVPLGAGICV